MGERAKPSVAGVVGVVGCVAVVLSEGDKRDAGAVLALLNSPGMKILK